MSFLSISLFCIKFLLQEKPEKPENEEEEEEEKVNEDDGVEMETDFEGDMKDIEDDEEDKDDEDDEDKRYGPRTNSNSTQTHNSQALTQTLKLNLIMQII